MIEFFQLRCFLAAARHEHFTRAAEEISVSQPTLSQQIARLEVTAGTPLFHRVGRGVRLTEAGRVLQPLAERLLAEEAEARRRLRQVAGLELGRLTLSALPALDQHLLPEVLARFRRRHPGIGLRVQETRPAQSVAAAVREGTADLGFLHLPCELDGLRSLRLLEDPFQLVLPAGHRLAGGGSIRLAAAAEEDFVWVSEADHPLHPLTAACLRAGFAPRITCWSGSSQGVLSLVAAGLGVALLPRLAIEERPGLVRVGLVDPEAYRTLAVVWNETALHPAAAEFLRLCGREWGSGTDPLPPPLT